jgi:hypothetical protein
MGTALAKRKNKFPIGGALARPLALLFVFAFTPSATQGSETQAGAQNTAAIVNYVGSDDSMEAATVSAMTALMNLAALNIPGAFSFGYKAYGQYINSEKLDDLELRTLRNKGRMLSVGGMMVNTAGLDNIGKAQDGESGISGRPTTFSRLDPSFLHRGEAAAVAEQFERVTGMSRDDFLRHLGSATDSDLSYDDPDLLQKVEARYEMFKAEVKNPDFRKKLETAESMFPGPARQELLERVQAMYVDAWQGGAGAPSEGLAQGFESSPAAPAPAGAQPPAALTEASPQLAAAGSAERAPSSFLQVPDGDAGLFIGIRGGDSQETLTEFFSAAEQGESDSIFTKVSKRYRILMPALLGRADVISAR